MSRHGRPPGSAGIDPTRRAETLSVAEFARLAALLLARDE